MSRYLEIPRQVMAAQSAPEPGSAAHTPVAVLTAPPPPTTREGPHKSAPIPRAAWTVGVTPNSRSPLIPPHVRAKIEAIEAEARAKGWPPELLWNSGFWDLPRGLAAVLDADDEIAAVTSEAITILRARRSLLRFRRHAA